jgi:hypothetical protein
MTSLDAVSTVVAVLSILLSIGAFFAYRFELIARRNSTKIEHDIESIATPSGNQDNDLTFSAVKSVEYEFAISDFHVLKVVPRAEHVNNGALIPLIVSSSAVSSWFGSDMSSTERNPQIFEDTPAYVFNISDLRVLKKVQSISNIK